MPSNEKAHRCSATSFTSPASNDHLGRWRSFSGSASLILLGGSAGDRFGSRSPLVIGPSVTAAGYAILGLSGGDPSYWTGFLPGLVVVSLSMTFSVAPLTMTAFDAAPDDRSGTTSGINNAAARAGGLIAIAAMGFVFGGPGAAGAAGSALADAYRLVMLAAAVLAGLSALTTALTVRSDPGDLRR